MIQRNIFFCLLFLIAFYWGNAQNNLSLYQFPQEVPQKYVQNAAYQSARIIASGDPTFTSTELVEFAQRQAYVKRSLFLDGDVYFNWENYEEYLNKVLHNLLPDEYRNDTNLHVYLRRTSNYNAITMHDGTIFFNVGALADIENEAALALILGHEFAHYSNRHIITGYKKELKAKRKSHNYDDYLDKEIENAEYSRSQELMADSIGILLALKAGYDVRYGFNNFYTFMDFKKKDEIIKKAQKMEDDDEEDEEPVKTKPKTGTSAY